jgi:hypothetical protein
MKGYNTPPKESGPYERLTFIQEDPTLPNQRKKPRTLTACDRWYVVTPFGVLIFPIILTRPTLVAPVKSNVSRVQTLINVMPACSPDKNARSKRETSASILPPLPLPLAPALLAPIKVMISPISQTNNEEGKPRPRPSRNHRRSLAPLLVAPVPHQTVAESVKAPYNPQPRKR